MANLLQLFLGKIPLIGQLSQLNERLGWFGLLSRIAMLTVIVYLVAWPVPVRPVAWVSQTPTPAPEQWPEIQWTPEPNLVRLPDGYGPEDIAIDDQGRVYAGVHDGRILRWSANRDQVEELANTGGRPLGLHFDHNGQLLIADAKRGLLRLSTGGLEVLTTSCGGTPLVFTDDVDVDANGHIWFTEASARFTIDNWELDIIESAPNGRLCRYEPETNQTIEVLNGLYFANGVAIDPQQRFVLINETSRYRVTRYWLTGPKAQSHEVLIDNLPGFPDGISAGTNDQFWIALPAPRNALLDYLAGFPRARKAITRLPSFLQPAPTPSLQILGIDSAGIPQYHAIQLDKPKFSLVTSVQEYDGELFLGSLESLNWTHIPKP